MPLEARLRIANAELCDVGAPGGTNGLLDESRSAGYSVGELDG